MESQFQKVFAELRFALEAEQTRSRELEVNLHQTDDYVDTEFSTRSKMYAGLTAQLRAITEQLDTAAHRPSRTSRVTVQESVVVTRTGRQVH